MFLQRTLRTLTSHRASAALLALAAIIAAGLLLGPAGVRGGLIGAGIGLGIVLAATAAFAAVRSGYRRLRQ